jgi:hypothetical protein
MYNFEELTRAAYDRNDNKPSIEEYRIPHAFDTNLNSKSADVFSLQNETNLTSSSDERKLIETRASTAVKLSRPSSKSHVNGLIAKRVAASLQSCDHSNFGQELCYLCHQRQRRNVPIYLHEEQRQKEKEENEALAKYQHMRDMQHIMNEKLKQQTQKVDRAKCDAFNLGIYEAQKKMKLQRPKTSDLSVLKKNNYHFFICEIIFSLFTFFFYLIQKLKEVICISKTMPDTAKILQAKRTSRLFRISNRSQTKRSRSA